MRRQMAVLMTGLVGACASEPTAPDMAEPAPAPAVAVVGTWASRAQYPTNITDATSASVTDASGRSTLYLIGGSLKCCGAGQVTDAVRAYDPGTNTWTARARIPVRVSSTNGAAELDGKVYVAGGFSRRWDEARQVWRRETLKSLYVYTPGTNTWTRKRDMPIPVVNGASVGYAGKLYVATACYHEDLCPDGQSVVWRYDPATDRWIRFAERAARDWWDVSAGLIGGKLYLVDQFTGTMDILDPATGGWTSGPKRPYRACNAASTSLQAKLYLFGWCDDYPVDPETRNRGLVFDPRTNAWSEVAAAPTGGADASLARVFVNGMPRLSLVEGARPNNHYLFAP